MALIPGMLLTYDAALLLAAALPLAAVLVFVIFRPRKSSLVLSSWPQPLWLYIQAIAAIGKGQSKPKDQKGAGKIIQVVLSRPVHFSASRLGRYLQLAGFQEGTAGAVPLMYPLVESFRLVMQCMLLPAFPFNLLGAVLGRTRVVALRRVGAEEKLMFSCRLDPTFRTTPKGDTEVDFIVEAHGLGPATGAGSPAGGGSAGYQPVWRSVTTAIILSRRRAGGDRRAQEGAAAGKEPAGAADAGKAGEAASPPPAPRVIDTWELAPDTGRRYGLLNGDLNPIHLHPLLSRIFGFKRPIAHALYLTGRAEASLRNKGLQLRYPATLSADFKRPTLLPATLQCAWLAGADKDPGSALEAVEGARFVVLTEDLGKEVLVGAVSCHPDAAKAALAPVA